MKRFVVILVLLVGFVGFSQERNVRNNTRGMSIDQKVAYYSEKLTLDDSQKVKIKKIFEDHESSLKDKVPALNIVLEANKKLDENIKEILTEEQILKYTDLSSSSSRNKIKSSGKMDK